MTVAPVGKGSNRDLEAVLDKIREIRNFDFRREVERHVDPDGSIRKTFESNPFDQPVVTPPPAAATTPEEVAVAEAGIAEIPAPAEPPSPAREALADAPEVPAFVPPTLAKQTARGEANETEPPPFIPPAAVLQRRSRLSA